jgi:hypothetical protein
LSSQIKAEVPPGDSDSHHLTSEKKQDEQYFMMQNSSDKFQKNGKITFKAFQNPWVSICPSMMKREASFSALKKILTV